MSRTVLDARLAALVAKGNSPAVQYRFVSHDRVLHAVDRGHADLREHGAVTPDTTMHGLSVTKTLTAAIVLRLVEAGAFSLDASPHDYVRGLPYPAAITLRQLLTHTAGLPNPIPLQWTHLAAEHATFDPATFFRQIFAKHPTLADAPGQRVRYSNLGFQILGMVVQAVTGVTFERVAAQMLHHDLGIAPESLGFTLVPERQARGYHRRWSLSYPLLGFVLDRSRVFDGQDGPWTRFRHYYVNGPAYGGLIGTADGFAAYLQAWLRDSGGVVSRSTKQEMLAEHRLPGGRPSGMSMAWFVGSLLGESYRHHAGGGGGYYAELRLYPALRRASVLLLNRTGMRNANLLDRFDSVMLAPGFGGSESAEHDGQLDRHLSSRPDDA